MAKTDDHKSLGRGFGDLSNEVANNFPHSILSGWNALSRTRSSRKYLLKEVLLTKSSDMFRAINLITIRYDKMYRVTRDYFDIFFSLLFCM